AAGLRADSGAVCPLEADAPAETVPVTVLHEGVYWLAPSGGSAAVVGRRWMAKRLSPIAPAAMIRVSGRVILASHGSLLSGWSFPALPRRSEAPHVVTASEV